METLFLPALLILLLVLGVFMALRPELAWKWEHWLSVRDGEPTEGYLAVLRLAGLLLVLFSLGMGLYLLFG